MATKAQAQFSVKNWDEKPYLEVDDGIKFTRASVTYSYKGELVGEGTVEYLMFYGPGGVTTFTGLERFVGSIGGRKGSFVLQHTGKDFDKKVSATVKTIPGSGAEGLSGIRWEAKTEISGKGPDYPMTFEYDFE